MHTNPFDDDASLFSVVVNAGDSTVYGWLPPRCPRGWRIVFGEATRAQCLDYVERNRADMRPRSLREPIG